MAKKRKAPKTFEQKATTKSTKFNIEERFDGSEDEFYAGQDKILLEEGADTKRRRRIIEQEKDLQPSDEEILAYQDDDIDEDDESDDLSENEQDAQDSDLGDSKATKIARSKARKDDPDEDESSEGENWGTNRADYYDADVIETEADALEEENEARRLHQKQMKAMTEADFGFDESEWAEEKPRASQSKTLSEKLPEAQIPRDATEQQRLQILRSRYPELEPLAEDFMRLQDRKKELDAETSQMSQQISQGRKLADGLPVAAKRDALTAYLASISLYFAIVSSSITGRDSQSITAISPLELHEHAVIQTLSTARQLWDRVADEETAGLEPLPEVSVPKIVQSTKSPVNGTETHSVTNGVKTNSKAILKNGTTALKDPAAAKSKADNKKSKKPLEEPSTKKKSKKSKTKNSTKPLDLDTLMKEAATEVVNSESDFGDEEPLTEEQYAEKDRKRKSLRFYTSQIASKANKRGHASREAGGDDDLPRKERHRDRQERLMKAAEARGKGAADNFDEDAGDDAYDALPNRRKTDENDEYYDTLLNTATKKKADKKAKAEAYAIAAQEGAQVYEEETVGTDGKRAITYAIEKNKGLMPRRKKEVRNPRVKKRMKYDEKMKKLGSMKQVYKGGEGRGGYAGELTGIKTNVVKSVKL